MTHRQRVVVTPCPNGHVPNEQGKVRLSVHFAPRLTCAVDTTLADFPDWVDWPSTVNGLNWSVQFGTNAYPGTVESASARSDLWQALFAEGALVRSHAQPNLSNRRVRSYPARNVFEYLRKHYTDVAVNSPEDFPHIDELVGPGTGKLLPLHGLNLLVPNGTAPPGPAVEDVLDTAKVYTNGPPLTTVGADFYQVWRFHYSRTDFSPYEEDDSVPPVVRPTLDFHEVVSSAGQYPPLLRLLGLVVDLVVDIGTLPSSPTEVQALPDWTPVPPLHIGSTADVVTARTRCYIDGSQFRARPREEDPTKAVLIDGRLPLDDEDRYTLLQVDQDGGALKAIDFTENLFRIREGRSVATPSRFALPSLRSGGLSVAFLNRAVDFHDRVGRAETAGQSIDGDTPGALVLDAEDLTRGHRIDVWDVREQKWFSLAARTGTYSFPEGVDDVPYTDESWTSAAVTEDDSEDLDLYLQETLFRWGGWSLAAPRPGGRIATTQEEDPPVTTDPTALDPDFPVLVDTHALPGSLPRLRFDRGYSLRGRAVDLCGNSDPLDPLVADGRATPPTRYLRYEPVQTPPVLPHGPRTAGESLERIVLRSNYNADPPRLTVVARHVVPPKTSQVLAEQHGLFDTPFSPISTVDADAYSTITKYLGPVPDDPDAPVVQSEQGSFAISSERAHDPDEHAKSFYYPVDVVTLPYLPDPIARGAALRFYDHPLMTQGELVKVPFTPNTAWPSHTPFRLVLTVPNEVHGTPWFDEPTHQFYVPLDKADVVKVKLSAYLEREDLSKLGLWQWIVDAEAEHLGPKVVNGQHWMLTPYRVLTLVHAVRQPLDVPTFGQILNLKIFFASKQLNQTFVRFSGSIRFSRRSTSKVDVNSAWFEYVDRGPGQGTPTFPGGGTDFEPKIQQAVAFSFPGDREGTPEAVSVDPEKDRQEFKDTRHRRVTYTPVATTKFAEYFVQSQQVDVAFDAQGKMLVTLQTEGEGVIPGSVKVRNTVDIDQAGKVTGALTYAENTHFTVNTALGQVTLLKDPGQVGGYPATGQALTISYLVPPIVRPGPGDTPDSVEISIKSSAPPAAPKVVYVVPQFGWESTKGPQFGTYTSQRKGRGLRVYLERPWWSSGQDELLGVVLEKSGQAFSALRQAVVTRHGVDPVYRSTFGLAELALADFTNAAVATNTAYSLPGIPGQVLVAGHRVGFDSTRDLWYCDIVIETNSYFPFVKLALARFQPESVPGVHLSPIVVTDFCQLAPDRSVTVVPALSIGQTPYRQVTVQGQGYDRAGGFNAFPLVRVSLEREDSKLKTDLGWVPVGNTVQLTRNPNSSLSQMEWSGQIPVPTPPPGLKQRLVIEEFELHRTSPDPNAPFGMRLVYSDIVNL